ncbi:ankyrin repeat domain-containing protein [Roseofilum sp. Guam]|uniref:ankyrin repeat domain-containing protein n=1 Tax=Roseofilum sp. Guam TaxID=2821502 RepID=UPI001B20955A|nr:ankyrin repeat domain-containing protein [Roseofilum sp. Guam]MBP0027709.1 ankyrin repeat domain-containing protein [Roseofilum sp. Guam]
MNSQNEDAHDNMSPLFKSIEVGDISLLKQIIESGDDIDEMDDENYPGYTALDLAAEKGNTEAIVILIQAGMHVDYSGESSPLHFAIRGKSIDAVRVLISHGADLEIEEDDGVTPLMNAIMGHETEIVKLLVEAGADLNAWSRFSTVSEVAIKYGYKNLSDLQT